MKSSDLVDISLDNSFYLIASTPSRKNKINGLQLRGGDLINYERYSAINYSFYFTNLCSPINEWIKSFFGNWGNLI